MAVNASQSFNFKSYSDFQNEAPHLNTNALLRKGHMTVEGKRYNISLSTDNKISVSRDQTANKAGRFFNGMSDLFKHRMGDDASTSRSHRMESTLNYRRGVEQKASSSHSAAAPSQSHKPTSAPLERPKLTLDDFMRQEQERADYHGERPSEKLAQQAYARYAQDSQPTEPLRRTQSDPLPTQEKPAKSDNRTFDYFMQQENERASYHGESPSMANAQDAYSQHMQSQQPSRKQNAARPQAHNHAATPKPSTSADHRSEMNRIKTELDSASYYGTSPNVSKLEQQMYEASQRPVRTEQTGLRRHQSAPSVLQNASSSRTRRTEQNTAQSSQSAAQSQNSRGTAAEQMRLERGINTKMSQLSPREQQTANRTLALFNRAESRMQSNSKLEVLNHINDLMAKPAAQRNKGMEDLQGLLRDVINGKKL